MEDVKESQSSVDSLEEAVKAIGKNKETVAKASVNAITKMLKSLQKNPNDPKLRKTRMDNIIVKKYIVDVPGAMDLMKAIGFEVTETTTDGKRLSYLQIHDVDMGKLERAIDLLQEKFKEVEEAVKAPKGPAVRTPCAGGCGFWGEENQENYCSVCYKKKILRIKTEEPSGAPGAPKKCTANCGNFGSEKFGGLCSECNTKQKKSQPPNWRKKFRSAIIKIKAFRAFLAAKRLEQKNKSRCWKCKRKVGITGIECRCGYIFCGKHRYADEHDCSFDHKRLHRSRLEKENQQVVARKFDKLEDE